MDRVLLAYLAGAIDSDGCITIRRSTYEMRVRGDATNPVYHERVMLKQVTPAIPNLLRETFGGYLRTEKPQTKNSRPLHAWRVSDAQAAEACRLLLPFLRVKKRQAELALELRKTKDNKYRQASYWFIKEQPAWRQASLLTTGEVIVALGYASISSVSQAVRNGTLLALPYRNEGKEVPRFPSGLVKLLAELRGRGAKKLGSVRPPQLIAWRQSIFDKVRGLNFTGKKGTDVGHRRGRFKMA